MGVLFYGEISRDGDIYLQETKQASVKNLCLLFSFYGLSATPHRRRASVTKGITASYSTIPGRHTTKDSCSHRLQVYPGTKTKALRRP